jgi:peptidoglycan hydrolase-like protein with peptidoglycan-binding domain
MNKFSIKGATTVAILGGMIAGAVSASAALNLPTMSCSYTFNTNLRLGSRGADVMNLQKVLNMYPQTQVAESGAGSPGMETSTFGPATRKAVNKFQALHLVDLGITAPTGNVFAGTRGLLNQVCNGSVSTNPGNPGTPVVTTGPVSAMLGANQPSAFLISGQAAARIAEFNLSGTAVLKSVKLMRTGLSDDTTLTNVYLYDGMTRIAHLHS